MLMSLPFCALWGFTKQQCDLTPVVFFWPESRPSGQCWTSHTNSCRPTAWNHMAVPCARPFQTSVLCPRCSLNQKSLPSYKHGRLPIYHLSINQLLSTLHSFFKTKMKYNFVS